MGALKSFAYPILQRARYAKLISAYEKAKSLPMQENKIFMLSTSKGRLGGNLAAIKNYIEKNSIPFEIEAVTDLGSLSTEQLGARLAQSKFILVDDYEPCVYPLKLRNNQQLIQVWHAMGAFKRFGYGRETAEKNSLTHKNYTRAIVSSPEIVDIYAQAFGISSDKVIPVGTPRTDVFFDSDYVSSVKERLYKKQPLLKGKKLCLFAPTFRGQNVNDAEYPEEFINIEKFANSLGDDWAVILKMHPFVKKRLDIPQSVQNRVFDFSDEREINDILFITDVLVTDYSSVIFENAIVGNAAVLYAPDLADYDNGRGFYFDYKNYSCGKIVREQGDLAAAVLGANTTNDYYKAFKSRFVSMCDGNSTKRFVEKILEKE